MIGQKFRYRKIPCLIFLCLIAICCSNKKSQESNSKSLPIQADRIQKIDTSLKNQNELNSEKHFPFDEGKEYSGYGFNVCRKHVVFKDLDAFIVIAKINQSIIFPKIIGVTPHFPSGLSATGAMRNENAEIIIGGGFMTNFYPPTPVGLLIVNGTIINSMNPKGLSSIICVKNKTLNLIPKEVFISNNVNGALQVGPRLICDGKLDVYKNEPIHHDPAKRAFIGIQKNGQIIAGITESPVSLYDLARYLMANLDKGGLGCIDAVNLCGGGCETIVVRLNNNIYNFGNASLRQSGLIAFIR